MPRSLAACLLATLALAACRRPNNNQDAGSNPPPSDGGSTPDAAVASDAGTHSDASVVPDAAPPADAGGSVDAGPLPSTWCALPGSVVYAPGGGKTVVPGGSGPDMSWVTVPPGFCVHYFGTVPNARQVRVAPGGEVFIASPTGSTTGGGPNGRAAIMVLADDNRDGVADMPYTTFLDALPRTQGLLFANNSFYYQDGTSILRMDYTPGMRQAPGVGQSVVTVTPPAYISLLHWPRSIDIADDGTLYFTNGSDQGEVCLADRPFVGGVLKVDGTPGGNPVVKGLRNVIGIRCQRGRNDCYGVEMAKDYSEAMGGREKMFRIHQGDDLGFPCCAAHDIPYSDVTAQGSSGVPGGAPQCGAVATETVSFHIGRSPMGLDFEPGRWPTGWQGSALIGLHGEFGSWVGAKVVALAKDPVTGAPSNASELVGGDGSALTDFATGWDDGQRAHGRPDDVSFSNDGRLFLTNDVNGEILWFAPVDLPLVSTDGGVLPDAGAEVDAGPSSDAGTSPVTAEMRLFELSGTMPVSGQPTPVKVMDTTARFRSATTHDFDNRLAGLGCTADHYDAVTKPAPPDKDAGSLRMSGYAGGPLLGGGTAGNPIVCVRLPVYYTCIFPSGAVVSSAPFAAVEAPLGVGPIEYATSVGADFGALNVTQGPPGTLTVTEDLATIQYSTTQDTVLHPSCDGACPGARVAVTLTALAGSSESMGWPYPSVGEVRCVLPMASAVTIPQQAIAAMLGGDARLDTVITSVARLPAAPVTSMDVEGNTLVVDTGRGVFGRAPR